MRPINLMFLLAAFVGLTAAADVQPAVQPGGDIPPNFQPALPFPKAGASCRWRR